MKKLVTFFVFFNFLLTAHAQKYVSITGTDAPASGTAGNPYRTIRYAVTQNAGIPGTVINILAGTYAETAETYIGASVTLQAVGQVIVDAYNRDTTTGFKYMIGIVSASNVVIDGISFRNCVGNGCKAIYILTTGNNITIRNCSFNNIGWTYNNLTRLPPNSGTVANAIRVEATSAAAMTNINILNNDVSNCATGWGEAVTLTGNINGFLVEGNAVHHITNIGIAIAGNYSSAPAAVNQARNGTVRYNEVYNCMSGIRVSGGIYLDGAVSCIVERNRCYHNGAGISMGAEVALPSGAPAATGHSIRNNIVYENAIAGIFIGTATAGNTVSGSIYNNTFYHNATGDTINGIQTIDGSAVVAVASGSSGDVLLFTSSNCSFQNNIVYPSATDKAIVVMSGATVTGFTADYNLYDHDDATPLFFIAGSYNGVNSSLTYSTIAQFNTATGTEANSIFGVPGFYSAAAYNFIPTTGALLIDKGNPSYNAALSGSTDFAGNTRIYSSVRTDAGAYEYQGGSFAAVTYTFTGNGNWNNPANWTSSIVPPKVLTPGSQILIDGVVTGECFLNITQTVMSGAVFKVMSGKRLRVVGKLEGW